MSDPASKAWPGGRPALESDGRRREACIRWGRGRLVMMEKARSIASRIQGLVPMGDGQRGQSLIIVAFLIVALLAAVGLAVDLGLMYVEKVRLGRAVDAAALAGAQELPDENAAFNRMVEYLKLNGYDVNAEGFDYGWAFPEESDCFHPPCAHYHLVVSATQTVSLTFLRVLNFDTVDVSAHAIGENANRLDVALVIDVSGSMDDDTCNAGAGVGHGCSPWWASSTDLFYEDFSSYTTGFGSGTGRLCSASSPWTCNVANLAGAANNSRNLSGGGNHAETLGASGDDGNFYRYFDASPYDQIEIAFYDRTYSLPSTGRIRAQVAQGGPWLNLMYLQPNETWRPRVYARDSLSASNFGVQLGIVNASDSTDYGLFDNVRVRGVMNGKGPSISVSCTSASSNCTCGSVGGTVGCSFDNLAAQYKAQPIWDTLNAADWFITECKLGPDPDDPPCLDPDLDQVGLAYYSDDGIMTNYYPASGDSTTALELSSNYSVVTNTLWTYTANGWTNIGDGIYRGCEILSTNEAQGHHGRTNAVHVMILLSDGIPNRPCHNGYSQAQCEAQGSWARQHVDNAVDWAVQNGIIIFTVSLGSAADEAVMTDIAETTGGIHQKAETTDDLQAVFQQIAQHIYLRLTG
jgi:hypothetical protein